MRDPAATSIPFRVVEPAGIARGRESVRTGFPLPRGMVRGTADLRVEDADGHPLPLQARALARWSDGSVQWALLDVLVSVGAGGQLALGLTQGIAEPAKRCLRISQTPAVISIDTGSAVFRVPRGGERLIESIVRDGREQLSPEGLCVIFRDGKGRRRKAVVRSSGIEEQGALRAAVVIEGVIAGTDRRRPLEFLARLVFTVDDATLELEFRLRNPRRARHRGGLWDLGDPGSQLIGELSLELAPASRPERLHWQAEAGQAWRDTAGDCSWVLYQDSSGGERWDSPNHLGADGRPTVSFRGYEVRGAGNTVEETGNRATPVVEILSGRDAIACGVEDFWQNFPKALRWLGGSLQIALFPSECRVPVELQGGEQKRHRLWFAFGEPGDGRAAIARRRRPLQARLDPHAVEVTRAIYGFAAPGELDDPRYPEYVHTVIEGEHSFFAGREKIDEYGWRNFGDVYADHEAVRHKGAEPFISHYNNQYDVVLAAVLQGLRTGDARWHELAGSMARHVVDIDIYHTQDDKPAYNGGLFWHSDHHLPAGLATHRTYSKTNARGNYGGGPDNEHNYTSGLLAWYFLTGDPECAGAVLSLADFVIAMDDGSRTVFRLLDSGPTGNASKTVSMDYHGPGRGAGNSINALLDAFWLTRERRYLAKAEQLVRRCIHPRDDIATLALDEPEYRWSYLVFLQALGKYLDLKLELDETGEEFRYARDSLLHYANWMLMHERPYSEQLHKVLLPTETWPAQDIRKARVLGVAAGFDPQPGSAARLGARAREYAERCIADVLAFETAYLVRPRVLLSVYGAATAIESRKIGSREVRLDETDAHGPRVQFVSQRRRAMRWPRSRR